MFNWIRASRTRRPAPSRSTHSRTRSRLALEPLEDRTTPTVSSITSNFNGTAIPAGDYLWFSSVAKVSGLGTTPATVHVTDQTISFTANGTQYSLDVPDSTIVFDPANTSASADFTSGWQVASPSSFSGNVFLSGLSVSAHQSVAWGGQERCLVGGLHLGYSRAQDQLAVGSRCLLAVQFGFEPRLGSRRRTRRPMFTTIRTMLARPKTTGTLLSAVRVGEAARTSRAR